MISVQGRQHIGQLARSARPLLDVSMWGNTIPPTIVTGRKADVI